MGTFFSNFSSALSQIDASVLAVIVILIVIDLIWFLVLTFLVIKSLRYSKSLFGDTHRDDLKEILQEHIGRVGTVQLRLNDMEKIIAEVQQKSLRYISKIGVVRFNPFEDTGGDQSFSLALLDEADDGVVISSLHGRHRTRLYSKPVRKGESIDYDFSEEEKEAIRKAKALGHK